MLSVHVFTVHQWFLNSMNHTAHHDAGNIAKGSLGRSLERMDLAFELNNDPPLLARLPNYVARRAARIMLLGGHERFGVALALGEALANALYHGNLGLSSQELYDGSPGSGLAGGALVAQRLRQPPYCQRKIRLIVRLARDVSAFTVRDEGAGFNPANVNDPTDDDALLRSYGRGIFLMRKYMDEVRFNLAGNAVTLVKRSVGGEVRFPISRANYEQSGDAA
jgi:anti-sigma regulatory factor (Ser/Thr protein kinase)